MTVQERNQAIVDYNVAQDQLSKTRNTLRRYVEEAQREHSLCSSGRREVYDNLNLTANGVREPQRYDYTAPVEEPATMAHPEWYTPVGVRAMADQAAQEVVDYRVKVRTWLSENYHRAVPRDFVNRLFTELSFEELPTPASVVEVEMEFEFKVPAGIEVSEIVLKETIRNAITSALPENNDVEYNYVNVGITEENDPDY